MSLGLTPQQMMALGMGAPGGSAPNAPGPPLQPGQDPRSQYLAQALAQLSKTPQQGNAQGLGANLLAEALDQYGMSKGNRPPPFQPGQMTTYLPNSAKLPGMIGGG